MQPLPVLTEAHVKLVGPVQPAGRALNPDVIDRLVAALPSLVVKVTLNVALAPTTTFTVLVVEDVATMLSLVVGTGAGEDPPPPPPPPQAVNVAMPANRVIRRVIFSVVII